MANYKKFKDVKVGDFLFCADIYGTIHASYVYSVKTGKTTVTINHAWGGSQRFPLDNSSKDCMCYKRFVATTKDELAEIMNNAVNDYNTEIERLTKTLDDFKEKQQLLKSMSEQELVRKEKLYDE